MFTRLGMIAVLSVLLVASKVALAEQGENGLPPVRSFDPGEYKGGAQNWSIAQDRQGVVYIGNGQAGVLSFDGSHWSRVGIPNLSAVRSLAADVSGRIYVGAVGEFGYLAPDALGKMRYVSLLNLLDPGDREFTDVWQVFPTSDGVYFSTYSRLFRYRPDQISVWNPGSSFHFAFWARNTLFIREIDRGLLTLQGEKLMPVAGGERFATEKIYAVVPWDAPDGGASDAILIGTRTQGWWIFDGTTHRPWVNEADASLARDQIYDAQWLADGTLAVATLQGGLYILDRDGRLVRHLTEANGLPDDVLYDLFQDTQHGLWLALNSGVARVDLGSPLTQYDKRLGLLATVQALQRHQGRMYAGTAKGLFRLDVDKDAGERFSRIAEVPGQNWALLDLGASLLVATGKGVYDIAGEQVELARASDKISFFLLRSARDPSRIFVGLQDGVASMRRENGRWVDEGKIPGVTHAVHTIFEELSGDLWLGKRTGGVTRLTFPTGWRRAHGQGERVLLKTYGIERGLPQGSVAVYSVEGKARFAGTSGGILAFDESRERFVTDPSFSSLFAQETTLQVSPIQDVGEHVWMIAEDRVSGVKEVRLAARTPAGFYRWASVPLQPIAGQAINAVHADSTGITWFGGAKGIFRFDPKKTPARDPAFAAQVRTVLAGGVPLVVGRRHAGRIPKIEYHANSLRLEFSAPSFDSSKATQFQARLEGLETSWSDWSIETYRDYTNLPPGTYRFRVRARNVYGHEGAESTYPFRIVPPWYRTSWAFLAFAGALTTALWWIFRWRIAALRRHNLELAEMVALRTEELFAANCSLEEQTVTDPLTGLKNRRFLRTHISEDMALVQRLYKSQENNRTTENTDLLFFMVDIDHFKEVNDRYGHAAGDRVLEQMRDILLAACRSSDTPVRWGGEEFLLVGRFMDRRYASAFAERIRSMVDLHVFELGNGQTLRRTCSIGFACYPFLQSDLDRLGWEDVVRVADDCLYAAKRSGRNAWVGVEANLRVPGSGDGAAVTLPLEVLGDVLQVQVLTSLPDAECLRWQ